MKFRLFNRVKFGFVLISLCNLAFSGQNCAANSADFPYDTISVAKSNKLKAIRDSIGSISSLDTLYVDCTHPNGLPYHYYIPDNLIPGTDYPLVIFLHGYTDLTLDTHNGFPKGIWSLPMFQNKHPHILFLPRHRTYYDSWTDNTYRAMVMEALDDFITELKNDQSLANIDTTRIYLTGFSMGGMGTWNYILNYPNKFAATVPLSGFYFGPQNVSQATIIRHMPIWIFNGDGDSGVGGSRISYQVLKQAGDTNVKYHEYVNQGHVIDDFAYFTGGFMDWLFSQKLNNTVNIRDFKTMESSCFKLYQNFPNPVNSSTRIQYNLPCSGFIILRIYNHTGREIVTLTNGYQQAGENELTWTAKDLPNGVYFCRLQMFTNSLKNQFLSKSIRIVLQN